MRVAVTGIKMLVLSLSVHRFRRYDIMIVIFIHHTSVKSKKEKYDCYISRTSLKPEVTINSFNIVVNKGRTYVYVWINFASMIYDIIVSVQCIACYLYSLSPSSSLCTIVCIFLMSYSIQYNHFIVQAILRARVCVQMRTAFSFLFVNFKMSLIIFLLM